MKSRFKKGMILWLVCLIILLVAVPIYAVDRFPDTNGHWAQVQIEKMISNGHIKGYSDGSFKPNGNITRAEFVVLINRLMGNENGINVVSFNDVKNTDWFYVDIGVAIKNDYIQGYANNEFRPNQYITREQVAVIIERALNSPDQNLNASINFSDQAEISEWAKKSVSVLIKQKIVGGYPNGQFKPKNNITRGEAVVILDRAFPVKNTQVDSALQESEDSGEEVIQVNYNISYFNSFVKSFKLVDCSIENANYYNIIGYSNDKTISAKFSEKPVLSASEIKAPNLMYSNSDNLIIEFYSDLEEKNIIAIGRIQTSSISINEINKDDSASGVIIAVTKE